jgi:uncharacterized protein YegL
MSHLDDVKPFDDNPEPRAPCVLLLDSSYSMTGEPIAQLNDGLRVFEEDIKQDSLASKRSEVAIFSFGGTVDLVQDFVIASAFSAPTLRASGNTPMGEAIERAIDLVDQRKSSYKSANLNYFRPWVFLVTDGAPTDPWEPVADRLEKEEERGGLVFFAVGVENADFELLSRISRKRPPVKLRETRFREMFLWLSQSQKQVSGSRPGDHVQLPSRDEWAEVPT